MIFEGMKTKRGADVYASIASNKKFITTNLFGKCEQILIDSERGKVLDLICRISRSRSMSKSLRDEKIKKLVGELLGKTPSESSTIEYASSSTQEASPSKVDDQSELKEKVCTELINFFSEYEFIPAARFVSQLTANAHVSKSQAKKYVENYFKLIDNPNVASVIEKMKSDEFKTILDELASIINYKNINNRLEIYYGPAGTGKTTKASLLYPNAEKIGCNCSMLPSDLLETFDFNDATGKPVFKKSATRLAMENGEAIIWDEGNLLSMDSLRFAQSFLDDKKELTWKDEVIKIKDGFKVILTMNLNVNGQIFSLPEPIVDRASLIKEFNLDGKMLASIAF